MYSRYVPRPGGGYDRRLVPDPPAEPQATGTSANSAESTVGSRCVSRTAVPGATSHAFGRLGQQAAGAGSPGPPHRPPPFSPRPPPMAPPDGLLGPNDLLGNLLPRGLDTEDLLVLAVLLLAMKQDGAVPLELLIAAALYLFLQ